VAYDLVLKDVTVQVTIGAGPPEVRFADLPRPRDQVQLRIVGDLPSLARTLAAGRLRRLLGRGMAEVSGDRRVLEGLRQVVRAPRTLQQLDEAGIVLDPDLAFTVVSRMIAPAWTRSERFTIAHETPGASEPAVYLQIADGAAPRVAERASEQAVTTTIVCPPEALLPVLSGQDPASAHVRGDRRPLSLLVHWVQRAQSG
jgi:hypothetical protein